MVGTVVAGVAGAVVGIVLLAAGARRRSRHMRPIALDGSTRARGASLLGVSLTSSSKLLRVYRFRRYYERAGSEVGQSAIDRRSSTDTIRRPERASRPSDVTPPRRHDPPRRRRPTRVGMGSFPQIADYAFLSDCEQLPGRAGRAVEWMCLPRPDSPSVFTAMLDRGPAASGSAPTATDVAAARRYLPGTLVLETTWQTRDRLAHRPRRADHGALAQRRRAVEDAPPLAHRLRRRALPVAHLKCVSGAVDVRMNCEPVFDYGSGPTANGSTTVPGTTMRSSRPADGHPSCA